MYERSSYVKTPYLKGGGSDTRRLALKMELQRKFGSIDNAAKVLEVSAATLMNLCQGRTKHVALEVRRALYRHFSSAELDEMLTRECDRQ